MEKRIKLPFFLCMEDIVQGFIEKERLQINFSFNLPWWVKFNYPKKMMFSMIKMVLRYFSELVIGLG